MTVGNELTEKSTDPTMVARATTYSGNVVRWVHVFSDEAGAVYAEHFYKKERERNQWGKKMNIFNYLKKLKRYNKRACTYNIHK